MDVARENEDGVEWKRVRIERLHLEEDAGKSIHDGSRRGSLVDFNRCGVPLAEIVTEPDITSPEEARLFLRELRNVILYSGVSDVKMEEGSLRCDANISLSPAGTDRPGTLTEIKNINSFSAVKRALQYEAQRQRRILEGGERVVRETRHWDEDEGITRASRSKEEAQDYRYFPEPDLVPLRISRAWVSQLRDDLPELPGEKRKRYLQLGLPLYDATILLDSPGLADFFEQCVEMGADPKQASNWLMGELLGYLNSVDEELSTLPLQPGHVVSLLDLLEEDTISSKIAKEVFEEVCETGQDPEMIVEKRGLTQISDEDRLESLVTEVIEEHPDVVEDILGGKDKAIGYLVGQIMQKTQGKANPQLVNELLREKIYD